MMNRSLAVVCDELHITNLESILHETVCGICVEALVNMKNITFEKFQSTLNETQRHRLNTLLSECANALPSNNLAGGIH